MVRSKGWERALVRRRTGSDLSVEWLAFEGSADYRRTDFGDTRVHTYPVQVSAWLYLLPGKTAEPVYSRRRLVLHDGKRAGGFDDTQNRFGGHAGPLAFLRVCFVTMAPCKLFCTL